MLHGSAVYADEEAEDAGADVPLGVDAPPTPPANPWMSAAPSEEDRAALKALGEKLRERHRKQAEKAPKPPKPPARPAPPPPPADELTAEERAHARALAARARARAHARQKHARIEHHRWAAPSRVVIIPRAPRTVIVQEREEAPPPAEAPAAPPTEGARGGLAVSVGATNVFGLVPLDGDLMAGARLHLATSLPVESSRWLSNAVFGLTGGIDVGDHRGVEARVWRAGGMFALGAPWSRDVLGIALEGGLLGSHYYDSRALPGPRGDTTGPKFYGLGRLVLQAPLRGDVRPYLSGELGVTERADDKPSALVGLGGGIVWNAW
jgi:hypothetical protein